MPPVPPAPALPPAPAPTPTPLSIGAAARQGFRKSVADQKKDLLPALGRSVVDDARWLVIETAVVIALVGVLASLGGMLGLVTFGTVPGALIGAVVGIAVYCILRFVVFGAALVLGIRAMRTRV